MNKVRNGNWIWIGSNRIDAVICKVLSEHRLEIVYFDSNNKAINEYVIFKKGIWIFENSNPCGGYAENSQRLSMYVSTLKEGRYRIDRATRHILK